MKDKDFGVYGKGMQGYVQYMLAHEEAHRKGGGRGPSSNGCLTLLIQAGVFLLMMAFFVAALV